MAHHVAPDGKIYADTAFLNAVGRLPGMKVKHMGFGEFSVETPKGELEFDRMRGREFPGQSGRSHQLYPQDIAKWVVHQMEQKGLSEKMAAVYDYSRTAGEGDMEKSVSEALQWIDRVEGLAKKAKAELKSRKEPGRSMSEFVGVVKGFSHEEWYEHFYR